MMMSITMKASNDEDDDTGGGNWWGFKWKQEGRSLRVEEAEAQVAKAAKVSSSESWWWKSGQIRRAQARTRGLNQFLFPSLL